MSAYTNEAIARLVEPARVHRSVYHDPALFELEMERIWGQAWIYVGHDSQVPNPGDFYTTDIGLKPVIMVRHKDGSVRVLHNRCGHKAAIVEGRTCGHAKGFKCPYHGWSYKTDGTLIGVPHAGGYKDTGFEKSDPQFSMSPLARVDNYRGFVFASLAKEGPDLRTFLRGIDSSFDNLVDRAPEGELEHAGGVLRFEHDSNWKMFIENLNDTMHPMVAHGSVGDAARQYMKSLPEGTPYPAEAEIIYPFGSSYEFFDKMGVSTCGAGHGYTGGTMSIHSDYSDIPGYWEAMVKSYGEARTKEILSVNRHNTVAYPSLTIKGAIQSIRVVRPVAVDKTIIETHHLKLKGAPEAMFRRTIKYSLLINSHGGMVGPDDRDCYARIQRGSLSLGAEWIDMHRYLGGEEATGEPGVRRAIGTSDVSFRHQYQAWLDYMTGREMTGEAA